MQVVLPGPGNVRLVENRHGLAVIPAVAYRDARLGTLLKIGAEGVLIG